MSCDFGRVSDSESMSFSKGRTGLWGNRVGDRALFGARLVMEFYSRDENDILVPVCLTGEATTKAPPISVIQL